MSVEQMANSKRQSYLNLSRKIVFKVKLEKNINLGRNDHTVIKTVAVKDICQILISRTVLFVEF